MELKKGVIINIAILLILISIAYFVFIYDKGTINEQDAICIGENSVLYMQLGCTACERQKEMFGENINYLTIVDCTFEGQKCLEDEITHTPSWIIKGEKYAGVQTINKLKELTGC